MERETKETIVLNSTPLIYLSKAGLIEKLVEIFKIRITSSVYREVVINGKKIGAPEANVVESLISSGAISIEEDPEDTSLISETYKLGLGESSTMLLASNINCVAIIDDERARKVGKTLGVNIHGTLFLLKLMLILDIVSIIELKEKLEEMIQEGFRIASEVMIKFIKDAENQAKHRQTHTH